MDGPTAGKTPTASRPNQPCGQTPTDRRDPACGQTPTDRPSPAADKNPNAGPDPAAIADATSKGTVRALYLNPTIRNPTTETIGVNRRAELVEIARRFGIEILEDDPYGFLPADSPPPPDSSSVSSPSGNEANHSPNPRSSITFSILASGMDSSKKVRLSRTVA